MNAPDGLVTEEEWALEQEAVRQLHHFIQMAVDDKSEKRIKVSYVGRSFFGDFYLEPATLQRAMKQEI